MFKTTMLAAFVAVSVSAMAQNSWRDDSKESIDSTGKSQYDIKCEVLKQDQYLSAGDAMTFELMLDRMPGNAEKALCSGLFCAHRQAVLVRHQIIASMLPTDSGYASYDQSVMAQETDNSMRPMRMVMQPDHTRDIDYESAFDILTADLGDTETTQLMHWWDGANDRQRDIVVRLLKIDAKKADDPIYKSRYINNLDWVVNTP